MTSPERAAALFVAIGEAFNLTPAETRRLVRAATRLRHGQLLTVVSQLRELVSYRAMEVSCPRCLAPMWTACVSSRGRTRWRALLRRSSSQALFAHNERHERAAEKF